MEQRATVFESSSRDELESQMRASLRDAKTTAMYWAAMNENSKLKDDNARLRFALRQHRTDVEERYAMARKARAARRGWRTDLGKAWGYGLALSMLMGWIPFGVVALGASGYLNSAQFRIAAAAIVILSIAVLAIKHAESKRPPER